MSLKEKETIMSDLIDFSPLKGITSGDLAEVRAVLRKAGGGTARSEDDGEGGAYIAVDGSEGRTAHIGKEAGLFHVGINEPATTFHVLPGADVRDRGGFASAREAALFLLSPEAAWQS